MANTEHRASLAHRRTRARLDRWVTLACLAMAAGLVFENARALPLDAAGAQMIEDGPVELHAASPKPVSTGSGSAPILR